MSRTAEEAACDKVFVSLGTNLGALENNLGRALMLIEKLPLTRITGRSRQQLTSPVGLAGQPDFLNQVIRLSSGLPPEELLECLLEIEGRMGRLRRERWGRRLLCLDIPYYGNAVRSGSRLKLPHPEIGNRPFFSQMVAEIDPDFSGPDKLE